MTETLTGDGEIRQVWASDRRKATMATRLLVSCLGIEAEPGFNLTDPDDRNLATRKPKALGECLFKDAFCESMDQESWHLQLLVVDEATGAAEVSIPTNGMDLFVPNATMPVMYTAGADGRVFCIRPKGAGLLTEEILRGIAASQPASAPASAPVEAAPAPVTPEPAL